MNSPEEVQSFLYGLDYDYGLVSNPSVSSVLETGKSDCLGGALTAAYFLGENYGTELLTFPVKEPRNIILGHIIYMFSEDGKYGGVGKSRDETLEWRDPVYERKEDLSKSYLKHVEIIPNWWITLDLRNLPLGKIDWINGGKETRQAISKNVNIAKKSQQNLQNWHQS